MIDIIRYKDFLRINRGTRLTYMCMELKTIRKCDAIYKILKKDSLASYKDLLELFQCGDGTFRKYLKCRKINLYPLVSSVNNKKNIRILYNEYNKQVKNIMGQTYKLKRDIKKI